MKTFVSCMPRLSPGVLLSRVSTAWQLGSGGYGWPQKMSLNLNRLLQQHAVEHAVVDGFVQVY